MDSTLWAHWSTAVEPDDTLLCVGDMAMGAALGAETWERALFRDNQDENAHCLTQNAPLV